MCGRTCLTLDPTEIQNCCKYSPKGAQVAPDKDVRPEWRSEFNFGKKYEPSFNIAPTDVTPVLVSADHFAEVDDESGKSLEHRGTGERVIVPMMWGMIPAWHKGDYKKHGLTTNNCRLEHMLDSKLYARPLKLGQRCVILCEGFYEWQTTVTAKPSERSVYYFHMPQSENVKIHDKSTWTGDAVNLLKCAGLFDIWEDENGDKIYSYSVITFQSNKSMSWLHYRMPAILETEQQVCDWLDFKTVSTHTALDLLQPATRIKWHQVTKIVNNARNKSEDCNKPLLEVANRKKEPKSSIMKSWLLARKRKEEELRKEQSASEGEDGDTDSDGDKVTKRRKRCDEKRRKVDDI